MITPITIEPSAPFCSLPVPTPLTASSSLFLFNLVRGKSHVEATTKSRQGRDTGLNSFQLLLQLQPNPGLHPGPRLTLREARCRRDLAVRHVLAVGFRSYAGAVHKRACTNLRRAGQNLYSDTNGAVVVFAVESAVAEARISEKALANDWMPTKSVRNIFLQGVGGLTQEPHSSR